MKTITVENYEEYIIDFVDNSLSAELNAEMLTLLNLHPTIADEVLQFRNLKVTPDHTITFAGKADLMRPETPKGTPIWRRPIFIAASMMMISCILGLCLYTSGDSPQSELVESEEVLKYKPIEKSVGAEVVTPNKNTSGDVEAQPLAKTATAKQLPIRENNGEEKAIKQVVSRREQMKSNISIDQTIAHVSNPIRSRRSEQVSSSIPSATRAVTSPNNQVALIENLRRISPIELNSSVDNKSYIANLDMEIIERDNKIRFYAVSDRRLISTFVTALIPSFANEEVLFLPQNLDKLEVELLPSYIKNRKVKH